MTVYKSLLQRLIPARCAGCGGAAQSGFCDGCRGDFARVERPCLLCGLASPVAACPRANGAWRIAGVVAPFCYTEPLRGHVQSLKFAGRRSLGRALGELLANDVANSPTSRELDALVAVPLHRARFLARGYNQAIEIARPVAADLRARLLIDGIDRIHATAAQTELPATRRRANLRGAFRVTRDVTGMRLAIVDDVMTTGATANALALALRRAGAQSVYLWAVARSL